MTPLRATISALWLPSILLLAVGCTDSAESPFQPGDTLQSSFSVDIEVSEVIPTVILVEWTMVLEDVQDVYVEYGPADGWVDVQNVDQDGDRFYTTLIGLKPSTEYDLTAVVLADQLQYVSAPIRFTTGAVPTDLPDIEVTVHEGESERQGYFVTSIVSATSSAAVIDGDGDLVWWHDLGGDTSKVMRNRITHDGRSMLYLWEGEEDGEGVTQLVRVSLDGTSVELKPVESAHHDFVELPDGTVAVLTAVARDLPGWDIPVLGDALVEYGTTSSVAPKTIWSSWDTHDFAGQGLGDQGGVWDWTHANALDYDPETDTYALSMLGLSEIIVIDRATGEVLRKVGGDDSDYVFSGGDAKPFEVQHQFQFVDGGLLLFNNGTPDEMASQALELALDDDTGEASTKWSFTTDPPVYCPALGDVNRLNDGDTLVTWSGAGQMDRISPDGELLWRLNLGLGGGLGYTTLVDSLEIL